MKYLIGGIVALVIVFGAIGYFVPLVEVAYAERVEYQDTETYLEDETYTASEPYQNIETYTEKEPYQDIEIYTENVPLKYEVISKTVREDRLVTTNSITIGGSTSQSKSYTPLYIATVSIKNTDDIDGDFRVSFSVSEPLDGHFMSSMKPIAAGDAQTFECPAFDLGEWEAFITPPTKSVEKEREVTKYRDVEKSRNVTKYREVEKTRQVEKQRPVTKQKTETRYKRVPLFESLFAR